MNYSKNKADSLLKIINEGQELKAIKDHAKGLCTWLNELVIMYGAGNKKDAMATLKNFKIQLKDVDRIIKAM